MTVEGEVVHPEVLSPYILQSGVKTTLFVTDGLSVLSLFLCVTILQVVLMHNSLFHGWNCFPVNATMFCYVMSDCVFKFDGLFAPRTGSGTCGWSTGLLCRLHGDPLRFVDCGLAVSIEFLLTVEALLAGNALELT